MKKTVKITILSILLPIFSACGFLDENMNTHYSGDDIFGSEAALEAFMNGCYSAYAVSGFYGGAMCEWLAPASAIVHWGLSSTPLSDAQKRWQDCLNLSQYSRNPYNVSMYRALYGAIYKCNLLISSLPDSPVAQEYKDQIEAEARYVRAQAYFHIVRRWGNAPIHLDPPTTIPETNGEREDFWKIYDIVLKDLDYAEVHGRDYDVQVGIAGTGSGRVCKNAATALKSLVYLTVGTLLTHSDPGDNFWVCSNDKVFAGFREIGIDGAKDAFEKALACAKDVMPETSTVGTPYRLAANYAQLFSWTNPEDYQLRERIFVIPSTSEWGNSQLATWSLPGFYQNTANNIYYGRFRPSRFLFQKWCEAYGGEKGAGNAANIYIKCGDPRIEAALIYDSYPAADGTTAFCYPNANYILNSERGRTFPYFKKYYDPKYDATAGYADLYAMRLAEVYLIAAEAAANLCTTPGDAYGQEAMQYVNVLLARARQSTPDGVPSAEPADWTAATVADKDALIEKIFWERAFEMTGEQHEYFDTHRMGAKWFAKYVTIPANEFLAQPEQADYGAEGTNPGHRSAYYGTPSHGADNVYPVTQAEVRKGLICAFPNDELVYNTALSLEDQNPTEVFWE